MLDITTTPSEVAPTAHYSMGGVWVRPEDHGTGVEGLYAIGEASSGLHGANRLGGNSLIELLVFGRIVGEAAAAYSARLKAQQRSAAALAAARTELDAILAVDGHEKRSAPTARHPRYHDRARGGRAQSGRTPDRTCRTSGDRSPYRERGRTRGPRGFSRSRARI